MSKSLATESSAGAPKKHFLQQLGAIMAAILLAFGLTSTVTPAFAAGGSVGVTATITPTEGTGSGTIVAQSIRSDSVQLQVQVDGVVINVLNTVSGGNGSWATPTTTLPLPYEGLLPGQVLTVVFPSQTADSTLSRVLASYTQVALPDPVQSIFPQAPSSNGTVVTFPVVTGYQYEVNGVVQTGSAPIPVGGILSVDAVSTSPTVTLEGTTHWDFPYVAPALNPAIRPQQPDVFDEPGVDNDSITVYAGVGFSNPMLNGAPVEPGNHNVTEFINANGALTVSYTLLPGYGVKGGSATPTFGPYFFTGLVPDPVPPHGDPEPTPAEPPANPPANPDVPKPAEPVAPVTPAEPAPAAPVVPAGDTSVSAPVSSTNTVPDTTSATQAAPQAQQQVVGTEDAEVADHEVQTAAAGAPGRAGWLMVAGAMLLLVATGGLYVRRSRA